MGSQLDFSDYLHLACDTPAVSGWGVLLVKLDVNGAVVQLIFNLDWFRPCIQNAMTYLGEW